MSTAVDKYSFKSKVTGKNEIFFEMEGLAARLEYMGEDARIPFHMIIEDHADHIDIERKNDGNVITLVGNRHAVNAQALGETFNAHVYNLHDWDELTEDNMAVGMAYDTWMDGDNPRPVRLTGDEAW
jgi:hypothetical protein